jgi:cobalt-zinc-cadmium efflux system outer membrane protein
MALYRAADVRPITKRPIAITCFFVIASASVARSERPFSDPVTDRLRIPASRIRGPEIPSQIVDLRQGIGPDEAATIALYSNPALRAIRDRRGLAGAQLIQAGILPNPVVSYERDYVSGGNTAGTITGYNLTAGWELTALIPYLPKQTAARKNFRAVDLDVAWQEWQVAMNARAAVYRVLSLDTQVARAREANAGLQQSADVVRKATEAHEKTVLDLAAAESASQDSRATLLALEQEFEKQRLGLNKILGVEPETKVALLESLSFPTRLAPPDQRELLDGLESRRLDLLGLRQGLESQDATARAAILGQFPKMSLSIVKASDTTNVHTTGFNVAVDVPIFDRNQGAIATERATRQRLLDEYRQRVFEARSDVALAIADIRSLNRQIAAAEEAVPLLERLVSSAQTAVEQRNVDVLSYYTARRNLLQKRVQLIKLQEQLLEANTALEIASGRYLPTNRALQRR